MEERSRLRIGGICAAALAAVLLLFFGIHFAAHPSYVASESAIKAATVTYDGDAADLIDEAAAAQAAAANTAGTDAEETAEAESDTSANASTDNTSQPAETEATEQNVKVFKDSGALVFCPDEPQAGLIFYPETKVDYRAYAPLMKACAKQGVLCVLEKMPLNLPALGVNKAESTFGMKSLRKLYPDLKWYIGGHGMGGTIAAIYAVQHTSELYGVVLLGAYTSKNLYGKGLKLLSIYGSEDRILNRQRYSDSHICFPEKYKEYEISGGNHAFFGYYGEQRGDGTAEIKPKQQVKAAANLIRKFMIKTKKTENQSESETETP